ncbi:hypothetical protein ANCCEY_01888 [Ancylostoma ceylanicum]|uniref:Uncharacterized protein n=1 Tax=Ancylostoma ceylanicum TaxID=53326 RepID=A0A0D6M9B8_9BILA|nr:hypothetical protein ANCCEY_01888 [Ancylostoma ceylanicum]
MTKYGEVVPNITMTQFCLLKVWPTQSISGTSILKTARPPSRKSSTIDVMKISDAPILSAPKKTPSSPGSSMKAANKEPTLVVVSGQVQPAPQVTVQPQLIAPPPAQGAPAALIQPVSASPALVPTPGPRAVVAQPKPFTSSNMMISGKSSVRTASRAENARAANVVKVTAAPVSISAMRRKPLPKAFTGQTKISSGPTADVATAKSALSDLPVTTPPRTARAVSPDGGKTVSMSSRSSKSSTDAAPTDATLKGSKK